MATLQAIVEGIVTDIIEARHNAAKETAKLAEAYRDDAILRNMAVPALNISNVTVDLKLAFDDSAEQTEEINQKRDALINAEIKPIAASLQKMAAIKALPQQKKVTHAHMQRIVKSALKNTLKQPQKQTSDQTEKQITEALRASFQAEKIRLTSGDTSKLRAQARAITKKSSDLEAEIKKSMQKIHVKTHGWNEEQLDSLSSIKFDIKLDEMQWSEADTPDGGVEHFLSER